MATPLTFRDVVVIAEHLSGMEHTHLQRNVPHHQLLNHYYLQRQPNVSVGTRCGYGDQMWAWGPDVGMGTRCGHGDQM